MAPTTIPLRTRFESKYVIDPTTGCWLWTAKIEWTGYGRISLGGRRGRLEMAHRVAYELHVGPIPDGLEIDHLCRVRHCVNPAHLEAVTSQVNVLRGRGPAVAAARGRIQQRAKTHCPSGHPYSGANLYVSPDGRRRSCKTCGRIKMRKYRAKFQHERNTTT